MCSGLSLADGDHSDHGCAPVTMITAITMVSQAHVIMVITMVSQAHGDHRGEPWLTMVITMIDNHDHMITMVIAVIMVTGAQPWSPPAP